ncbi:MAG: hypothetical protein J6V25_02690, partial [Oscillospiraceae bacterium]|nr:hypothetical protein [Oscillospiraceae bacterium]
MNAKNNVSKKPLVRVLLCVLAAALLFSAGIGIGYRMQPEPEAVEPAAGYAANPAYEYMVAAAA